MGAAHRAMHNASFTNPKSIANLSGWYDASQIGGLSDNTAVGTWADLSGNGFDQTQATAGNKPTYYSSTAGKTVNGLPAVWFAAASSQYVSRASDLWANASDGSWSVFTVAVATTTTTESTLVDQLYPGAGIEGIRLDQASGVPRGVCWDSTDTVRVASPGSITTGQAFLLSAVASNTARDIVAAFNGSSATTSFSPNNLRTPAANSTALGTLLAGGPRFYWNGAICEVVIYSRALSSGEQAEVESYLKSKWGTP